MPRAPTTERCTGNAVLALMEPYDGQAVPSDLQTEKLSHHRRFSTVDKAHQVAYVLCLQAVLIGERITGKGAVQALDHAVGVPLWEIEPLLGAIVVGLLIAALYPRRKQLVQDAQRTKKEFGDWLADAQVWVRRLACVSLASTIVVEVVTGKVCFPSSIDC